MTEKKRPPKPTLEELRKLIAEANEKLGRQHGRAGKENETDFITIGSLENLVTVKRNWKNTKNVHTVNYLSLMLMKMSMESDLLMNADIVHALSQHQLVA